MGAKKDSSVVLSKEVAETIFNKERLLKNASDEACKCIDSIDVSQKSGSEIATLASKCIQNQTITYQTVAKLAASALSQQDRSIVDSADKKTVISINTNENSTDYKEYYYELERNLMENCASLKTKIAANEAQNENSVSDNQKARKVYTEGIDFFNKKEYKKALPYFEKAVKIDPKFAFAWDNIGVCYRNLNNYDKALTAYQKSLEIDPKGLLPLQNIAIVYQYKKEYQKAIDAYEQLALVDKDNPEVFYGIGQVYTTYLKEYEKGLQSMCKAYNLYVEQKSPYRTDAETIISMIYKAMKAEGKEKRFDEILKENNISSK